MGLARVVNLRTGAAFVVVAVAVAAAIQSFSHIYWLGITHDQGRFDSALLPLSVDGVILAMTLILLHEARANRDGPFLAYGMLWLAIAATIAANVIFGLRTGPVGACVSAWPAAAFIGAVHVVAKVVRSWHADYHPAETQAVDGPEEAARAAFAASLAAGSPLSERRLAKEHSISRPRAKRIRTELVKGGATA